MHFEESPFIVAYGTDLMAGVVDLMYCFRNFGGAPWSTRVS
jgi:hypothetical protein